MNDIQKQLLILLQEIDEICEKHNIPYVLCGRTAKDACMNAGFLGEYVYASVLMHAKDFFKFRKIVSGMEGRATESILDNAAFPDGRAMRYVNENTTFMYGHNAHHYKHLGVYITIQQARTVAGNRIAAKASNAIDKLVTAVGMTAAPHTETLSRKKRMLLKAIDLGTKLTGKERAIRMLIRTQNFFMPRRGKKLAYIRKNKTDIMLTPTMLTSTKATSFEGAMLRTALEEDAFNQQTFGRYWATDLKEEGISSPHLLVYSDTESYKELETQDILCENRNAIQRMMNERSALSAKISGLRKNIEKNWDILFMTRERYRLYALYKPVEEELLERLNEGDCEYLSIVMKDYLENVILYAGKGWPLQVSPMLDSLALEMLKRTGQVDAGKKFGQLLASVTLKPVSFTLTDDHLLAARENLEQLVAASQAETL